ncbi:MAG: HD domain-containing protein [Lachnospiraceae bacterium]|nr:HD domain-containing protein [Lachnospiraceae bacterium]
MEYIRLQIGCLAVLLYIAFIYFRECKRYHRKLKDTMFDELLLLGIVSVTLDGATAYTVNHLETVNQILNRVLHALFLAGLDAVIFVLFLYMLFITGAFPQKRVNRLIVFFPFVANILLVVCNIHSLRYEEGVHTNYSMGGSVYTCFIMAAVYTVLTIVIFFKRWNYMEHHKRASVFTYLLVMALVTGIQMVFPETLISSIAVTIFVLGVYLNLEDPALGELSRYHSETIMGFANLIENRDNSTGGHIKRTSMYVQLIAEELRDRGRYKDILTKDYINNLMKAAPMHDIGKIAIPDAILQKPGKLTEEEFAVMKSHAAKGAKIIQETFQKLGDEEYFHMAYQVACYHHEKWNGKGYPEGLKEKEIPLCARIMAVADVFDAISEKRCYRDAMPLETCFSIIGEGIGQDFDPVIAQTFLDIREKVEKVHREFAENPVFPEQA